MTKIESRLGSSAPEGQYDRDPKGRAWVVRALGSAVTGWIVPEAIPIITVILVFLLISDTWLRRWLRAPWRWVLFIASIGSLIHVEWVTPLHAAIGWTGAAVAPAIWRFLVDLVQDFVPESKSSPPGGDNPAAARAVTVPASPAETAGRWQINGRRVLWLVRLALAIGGCALMPAAIPAVVGVLGYLLLADERVHPRVARMARPAISLSALLIGTALLYRSQPWLPVLAVAVVGVLPTLALEFLAVNCEVYLETAEGDYRRALALARIMWGPRVRLIVLSGIWCLGTMWGPWSDHDAVAMLPLFIFLGLGRPILAVPAAACAFFLVDSRWTLAPALIIWTVMVASHYRSRSQVVTTLLPRTRTLRSVDRLLSAGLWETAASQLVERPQTPYVLLRQARLDLAAGRLHTARQHAEAALTANTDRDTRTLALLTATDASLRIGDIDSAEDWLKEADASVSRHDHQILATILRSRTALHRDHLGSAADLARTALQELPFSPRWTPLRADATAVLVTALCRSGHPRQGQDAATDLDLLIGSAPALIAWTTGRRTSDFREMLLPTARWMAGAIAASIRCKYELALALPEEASNDLMDDLDDQIHALGAMGATAEIIESFLLLATLHSRGGKEEEGPDHSRLALEFALKSLSYADSLRHVLPAEEDRARWTARVSEAFDIALTAAHTAGTPRLIAELIELSRVQAVPELNGGHTDAILPPATVRVRGSCAIVRRYSTALPVDLEDAAAHAAGPGAWWLGWWQTPHALHRCLTPPTGQITANLLPLDALADPLAQLRAAVPVQGPAETEPEFLSRIARSPLVQHNGSDSFLTTLGNALLPAALRDELLRRLRAGTAPLPLAIAPAPALAHVPWPALIIGSHQHQPVRLIEVAQLTLAPSASLLTVCAAHPDQAVSASPLRLAVLDPTETDEYPALNGARALADPAAAAGAIVLGGQWAPKPATTAAIRSSLLTAGRASTVMFGCHAVGSANSHSSALIISAADSSATALTSREVRTWGLPPNDFPRQVALHACDTSNLAATTSGEWMSLAPSFLAAGARDVLTTVYPIPDLIDQISPLDQAVMAGAPLRTALRTQQLAALARWNANQNDPRSWPLWWASFAITGIIPGHQSATRPVLADPYLVEAIHDAIKVSRQLGSKTIGCAQLMVSYLDTATLPDFADVSEQLLFYTGKIATRLLPTGPTQKLDDAEGTITTCLLDHFDTALHLAAAQGVHFQLQHLIAAMTATSSCPGNKAAALLLRSRQLNLEHHLTFELTHAQVTHQLPGHEAASQHQRRTLLDPTTRAVLECIGEHLDQPLTFASHTLADREGRHA